MFNIFLKAAISAIGALIPVHVHLLKKEPSFLQILNEQFEINGRKNRPEVCLFCLSVCLFVCLFVCRLFVLFCISLFLSFFFHSNSQRTI